MGTESTTSFFVPANHLYIDGQYTEYVEEACHVRFEKFVGRNGCRTVSVDSSHESLVVLSSIVYETVDFAVKAGEELDRGCSRQESRAQAHVLLPVQWKSLGPFGESPKICNEHTDE